MATGYNKNWEVTYITMQGEMGKKTIKLGRMSDKTDVKNALKRMDLNIREVTNIKEGEVYAKGGVTESDLKRMIAEYNSEGRNFELRGAYGNLELWSGGNRLEVGSKNDIKKALIKYRFNEKYAKGGLTGNQHKLDVNKNGKLDAQDFRMLRGKKMADGGSVDFTDRKSVLNEYNKTKKALVEAKKNNDVEKIEYLEAYLYELNNDLYEMKTSGVRESFGSDEEFAKGGYMNTSFCYTIGGL